MGGSYKLSVLDFQILGLPDLQASGLTISNLVEWDRDCRHRTVEAVVGFEYNATLH